MRDLSNSSFKSGTDVSESGGGEEIRSLYCSCRDPPSTTCPQVKETPSLLEVNRNPVDSGVKRRMENVIQAIGLAHCSATLHERC